MSRICGMCTNYSKDLSRCMKLDMYCVFSQKACEDGFLDIGEDVLTTISNTISNEHNDLAKRKATEVTHLQNKIKKLEKDNADFATKIIKIEKDNGKFLLESEKKLQVMTDRAIQAEKKLDEALKDNTKLEKDLNSKIKLVETNEALYNKKEFALNKKIEELTSKIAELTKKEDK